MIRSNSLRLAAALLILVSAQAAHAQEWTDKSPHQSGFVTANGVKLHYLDWGGQGKALVFLTALGNSAHIYDDLAPKFTDKYHVVALTRRGHGQSDKPATGYDLPTLVEDIRQALDSLHLQKVTLVGHSFAGDELTRFATLYPERVDQLVYLDAAYDRSLLTGEAFKNNPFSTPQPTAEERASLAAYRPWWERNRGFWSDALEADLRETSIAPDGSIKASLSREVVRGIMKNAQEYRPDYSHIKAPVLSFYATPTVPLYVPKDTASQRTARDFIKAANKPYQQTNIEQLRRQIPRHLVIVELDDSNHYIFIKNPNEVLREMRAFLR